MQALTFYGAHALYSHVQVLYPLTRTLYIAYVKLHMRELFAIGVCLHDSTYCVIISHLLYGIVRIISPWAIFLRSALNRGWAYNTSWAYNANYHNI